MNPSIDITAMSEPLKELARLIASHTPTEGVQSTEIPGLRLMRSVRPSERMHTVSTPSLCIVAQGAKTATLGEESYRYDPATYLVTAVELPVVGTIVEASPQAPYLSVQLALNASDVLDIAHGRTALPEIADAAQTVRGIFVNATTPPLLEGLLRLLRLLDQPEDIPILAPLMMKEIVYRVLQGEQGAFIQQFAVAGSHANGIAKAIRRIRDHYAEQISIASLAEEAGLSASALHKHFKKVTSLSPLQYQKMVRLQEARRLLLTETLGAAEAGYQVGYESPTQFTREYVRLFGRPPMSDVKHVRGTLHYDA